MARIGVIGNPGAWSSDHLANTFADRTGFRCLIDLDHISLDLDAGVGRYGDVDLASLDAIVVKKLGANYSIDDLSRLEVLRYVNARCAPVFSDPERIQRVIDRVTCTVTLRIHDIPMPPTAITGCVEEAGEFVRRMGRVVLKPLFSTKARGMIVLSTEDDVASALREFHEAGNRVFYIQKMIELPGHDLGIAFLGGEFVAAYARFSSGESWNTTTYFGGRYREAHPPKEIIDLAHKAQEPFGLHFTCVDVAITDDGPIVFEVSAFGGYRGLKEANGMDIAQRIADDILKRVGHD